MVAESSTHEVVPEGVLIPPLQERTAARNMLVRWHVLIKELSTIIPLGKQYNPYEEVDTVTYTVSETLCNVLRDVKERGGEQQALARLAFTIYCREEVDAQEADAILQLTWALLSEMLTVYEQGGFRRGDCVKSGIRFTSNIPLRRVVESLAVTSTHTLY
jgi:hypothetical protein